MIGPTAGRMVLGDEVARKDATAIVIVTPDEKIIPAFRRIYHIRDGVTHEEAGAGCDTG